MSDSKNDENRHKRGDGEGKLLAIIVPIIVVGVLIAMLVLQPWAV